MKLGERLVHQLKREVENIGVRVVNKSQWPVAEVKGTGKLLPESEKVLAGARGAAARFALNHPEAVVKQLNPGGLLALQNPQAAENAFHEQLAQPCLPDDYQDSGKPAAERQLGVIEYQQDDSRIAQMEVTYGIKLKPKILTKNGNPVSVYDYVRPDGKVIGAPVMPVEEGWRPVRVPDIAGAIAAKEADKLINTLGLVDATKGEGISGHQAVLRTAIVNYAAVHEIGLSADFTKFVVEAFMFSEEHPELRGEEVIPALLKRKK